MQTLDYEFIKKYKQQQRMMREPVLLLEPKEVVQMDEPKEVVQIDEPQDDSQFDMSVLTNTPANNTPINDNILDEKEAPKEEPKQVHQEFSKESIQEVTKEIHKNLDSFAKSEDQKQKNALELIKDALDQINFALHLLQGIKKPPAYLLLDPVPTEKVEHSSLPIVEESEVVDLEEINDPIKVKKLEKIEEIIVPEKESEVFNPPNPAEPDLIDHISDVEEEELITPSKIEEEEEFKIVMPKKSKNKKPSVNIFPIKEKTKKDEFPSLGCSFTPIKKTGFWEGETKKSLEIAKSIAHIPSPPPISSPSPTLKKSIRMAKGGLTENDVIEEEECFDSTAKFRCRRHDDVDDDCENYW